MIDVKENSPVSQFHVEIIDGAKYEVNSNYVGKIPLLDLLKQILKRDMERQENE